MLAKLGINPVQSPLRHAPLPAREDLGSGQADVVCEIQRISDGRRNLLQDLLAMVWLELHGFRWYMGTFFFTIHGQTEMCCSAGCRESFAFVPVSVCGRADSERSILEKKL